MEGDGVTFKTPPCVYPHHAHMLKHIARGTGTHRDVLNVRTGGFSASHTHNHTHNTHKTPTRHRTDTHQEDTDNIPTPKPTVILRVF